MNATASIRREFGMMSALALVLFGLTAYCYGQGTMTFKFEGQPTGTSSQAGPYVESGRRFQVLAPGNLYLSGGGVFGYPDNGTGYLYMPDGNLGGVRFESTNAFPTSAPFNLISFDAAEYAGLISQTLTVIGYIPMAGTVTNIFTLDGVNDGTGPLQDFQTFYLDSSFVNLFRVDIINARFSLDNWTISGVPEPSSGALILLGIFSAIGWSKVRRKLSH